MMITLIKFFINCAHRLLFWRSWPLAASFLFKANALWLDLRAKLRQSVLLLATVSTLALLSKRPTNAEITKYFVAANKTRFIYYNIVCVFSWLLTLGVILIRQFGRRSYGEANCRAESAFRNRKSKIN